MNKIREQFQQLCIADYQPEYLIIYRHILYCILSVHNKFFNKESS
jgi:hypothetical protein